jgi:nitroreductase
MSQVSDDRVRFLRRLRATKTFTGEPVSQEAIEDILEVGRWSGSGSNKQPWEVVVIRDPEVRKKFGEWGANPAVTAPVVFLIVSNSDNNAFDEGRLAERLLLAASAHGLGSTVATLKNDGPAEAKRLLGIPEERRAIFTVSVGHRDQEARRARPANPEPRKPIEKFAHWDRF